VEKAFGSSTVREFGCSGIPGTVERSNRRTVERFSRLSGGFAPETTVVTRVAVAEVDEPVVDPEVFSGEAAPTSQAG
jgi:hypothetical protein